MLRPKSAVIVVTLCAGTFGCSKKVPECNALIKQLNESATAMETATRALTMGPKQSKDSLEKFDSVIKAEADKIGKVELTLPELQGFSKNYQTLLADTAMAAQSMSKAAGDLDGIQEAVNKGQSGWMAAAAKLNAACLKARRDCAAFGDKVTRQPPVTGIKPEEDSKKLEEYAKVIASLDVKNPDVKQALDDLRKNVSDFAAILKKSGTVQQDSEKAMKTMNEINTKEPVLIKSINDFCQAG